MIKNSDFVHLHCHSEYSNIRIIDSINKIPDMIKYVVSLGQNAMALTDHESVSGHVKYLKAVKELKEKNEIPQDFKPILGNEIYLLPSEEEMNQKIAAGENVKFYHFLLLAKDKEGHRQIRQLSSRAWERMFTYKGIDRVPTFFSDVEEVLKDNKGHLIASTACLGSYFAQHVLQLLNAIDKEEQLRIKMNIHNFINWCIEMFGKDDFYIEIQPSKESQEQIEYNKMAIKIAKAYGLKFLVSTDSHYIQPKDRSVHKAYLTSDEEGSGDREVDEFYHSTHFFTAEMLLDYLDYLDDEDILHAVQSTKEIADKIEVYDLAHKQIIPKIKLPNESEWFYDKELYDKAKKYPHIKTMLESDEIYNRYLISLVLKGVKEKINKEDYDETFSRIDVECKETLEISEAKDEPVSSYFVTMHKNIEIIWEEAQSIVGTSRGSAAGFIINYLLGITQINPLKQDGIEMPHWRFISGSRPELPDIDIDVSSHKRDVVFQCLQNYYESIGGKVVRVSTFGTETAKSAIITACRGLGINNDVALYLSSLIPVERGFVWDIEDCYYGNEEKGRKPVSEFIKTVDKYEGLLEVALGIQGLINKRSSHACGILIVNEDFTEHNAIMRTPSKEIVSQFNLEDSEYVGNIKYDILNTKTCSMIQVTMEMLIENGKMEWQGSLRKTYDKYLHPDVLDRTTPELWQQLHDGKLISAFQFDEPSGIQALRLIKPMNLLEATNANNLMRLMGDEGRESPMDMYVRYKNNIEEWYDDMRAFGLGEDDIKIVERHLLEDYGVCSNQEKMMLLAMDKDIAGFDVVEANKLRKGVAKKIPSVLKECEDLLYKKGRELGASKKLLEYIWEVQIAMQRGYGFSILHGVGYTYILIQQLNLIYYYPPIYWNTAVLLVESGALEQDILEDYDEDNLSERKEKTTNYGTIATAIGNLQSQGVHIVLPDINVSDLGFKPDEANDRIIYGLKGIMRISNDVAKTIIENRPYKSLQDFYERMVLTKREVTLSTGRKQNKSLVSEGQLIMLIKAGAFDNLEKRPREEILENFLRMANPPRTRLDTRSIDQIIKMGIIPPELNTCVRIYNYRKYVNSNDWVQDEEAKSIKWYSLSNGNDIVTEHAINFFHEHFSAEMTEGRDYYYDEDGIIYVAMGTSRKGSFEDVYKQKIKPLTDWIKTKECLDAYNEYVFEEIKRKHMYGNVSTWEMESVNFYYHEHELLKADLEKYSVEDFYQLPEEPEIVGFNVYRGMEFPKFRLSRIAGTVLDKDKNKHIVYLLTPTGVVQVKYHAGQYSHWDRTISEIDEDGIKKVIEESFFKRGNLLLVTGFRRFDQFVPRRYKDSIFQHSTALIERINENGSLVLKTERVSVD